MDSSDLHDRDPPRRPPPIWVTDSLFGLSDNSSSGLSTPFGSLDSTRTATESDDEDEEDEEEGFLAELTRQIAAYTLQDEEEEEYEDPNILLEDPKNILSTPEISPKVEEVDTTEDKSPRRKQSSSAPRRRRVARTESAHKRVEEGVQKKKGRRRGGGGGGKAQKLKSGSGMQAIFLGGAGYGTGASSGGTGVFLPRGINHPGQTEPKMKSGCSTVLIPTRVLQVLQLHHNNKSQSKSCAAPLTNLPSKHDVEAQPEMNAEEMQLPQEWTY
ncbi:unnamed protein product [Cuscuta epithymum]|uniref:Uncharacterized protein n=1 Tax=Cuscuta epithymum TaxID=186058 RepID=A0AAV0FI49_9ASTE|nr:unnamed protein product [Cuscuta epithymum]CAH9135328.1 unnamed protein product [Cuscuta epithymum]